MTPRRFLSIVLLLLAALPAARGGSTPGAGDYEGRVITSLRVLVEGSPRDEAAEAEMLSVLAVAEGQQYAAVRVRESLQTLFDSGMVSNARVEVSETCGAPAAAGQSRPLCVTFVVRRQVKVGEVKISLHSGLDAPVAEDELRSRLNMLEPGASLTEQVLRNNADLIQVYLRDKGFYRAEVNYTQVRDPKDPTGTRMTVVFDIEPGEQSRVEAFNINVTGFDPSKVRPKLELQSGAPFSRAALAEDIERIRQAIIAEGYLAPQLDDERFILDDATNRVTVEQKGSIGPKVDVKVLNYEFGEKSLRELLPIKREGTVDISAIVEGDRRLRNKIQESGYFFAESTYACTVAPAPATNADLNGTAEMCNNLNPQELAGRQLTVTYDVDRGRRFKLTDIRVEGTEELKVEDIEVELRTQKANALGFIPFLGYGRGYTSRELLEQDRRTIRTRMQDLGFRRAEVTVRQGVSLEGENLIITFVVAEGDRTRIASLELRGNKLYTDAKLRNEIAEAGRARCAARFDAGDFTPCFRTQEGEFFSRSQARSDGDAILNLYARDGQTGARMEFSSIDLPSVTTPDGRREERVRLVYTIRSEGDRVIINRIFVNGNVRTKKEAILAAIPLRENQILRADRVSDAERALYATDVFRQVVIHTEPAGETTSGFKKRDVIIDVEELKPREMRYGGGYSTDNGPLGFFDIRNLNMFGKLRQGAFRVRASRRQQLIRLEYLDPRWRGYGDNQFAPLALSAQYQRDTTVTRFFRSTIDRGSFGIVQRLDEEGNPIDEFGQPAGEPTINRFTLNAETQRVIDRKTRSILFLRYSYEDVRLYNINSLLIASILRPDRAIRLSRLGATFVRDTRDSQFDTTRGDFLTLDYSLALRQLGGNLSFNKFQLNYRRYYRVSRLRNTVLAGNVTLGLAELFNPRDRDEDGVITDVDRTLPISERFFAGGSTTLRGFNYEEAGPRVVVPDCFLQRRAPDDPRPPVGCGIFRNSKGELIQLDPFTTPVGGNALAVINLEARTSLTKAFQVVPFYDGGNVFRRIGDIFGRNDPPAVDDPNLTRAERINQHNLRAVWTHTIGLGVGIKTPLGGTLSIDYGWLVNPPQFLIPQADGTEAIYRLKRGQLHFRFTRAF